MKLRIRFAHQVVGLFVLVAAAVVIGALISMGANQRWFAKSYRYYSIFATGNGLSVGMPVDYRGFEIGKITEISLLADGHVRVDFYIRDTYRDRVVENSILQLMTSPIGLGSSLVFHRGAEDTSPLPEQTLIPAYSSKEGNRIVENKLAILPKNADAVSRIVGEVEPLLRNANVLLGTVHQTLNTVNGVLVGEPIGPLAQTLAEVNLILRDVRIVLDQTQRRANALIAQLEESLNEATGSATALMGQAQRTISDATDSATGLVGQVEQTLADTSETANGLLTTIDQIITSAEREAGMILANVDSITENIDVTTEALRDPTGLVPRLLDPSGSLDTLLNDNDRLYSQIESILQGIDTTIAELQDFTGFVNATSPDIATILQEGREALDTGQDVLEGLKNNPLIRGGVPTTVDQPATFQSFRDESF